jgi:hypothetical protein
MSDVALLYSARDDDRPDGVIGINRAGECVEVAVHLRGHEVVGRRDDADRENPLVLLHCECL